MERAGRDRAYMNILPIIPWTESKSTVVSMCKAEAKCFKLFLLMAATQTRNTGIKPGTTETYARRMKTRFQCDEDGDDTELTSQNKVKIEEVGS